MPETTLHDDQSEENEKELSDGGLDPVVTARDILDEATPSGETLTGGARDAEAVKPAASERDSTYVQEQAVPTKRDAYDEYAGAHAPYSPEAMRGSVSGRVSPTGSDFAAAADSASASVRKMPVEIPFEDLEKDPGFQQYMAALNARDEGAVKKRKDPRTEKEPKTSEKLGSSPNTGVPAPNTPPGHRERRGAPGNDMGDTHVPAAAPDARNPSQADNAAADDSRTAPQAASAAGRTEAKPSDIGSYAGMRFDPHQNPQQVGGPGTVVDPGGITGHRPAPTQEQTPPPSATNARDSHEDSGWAAADKFMEELGDDGFAEFMNTPIDAEAYSQAQSPETGRDAEETPPMQQVQTAGNMEWSGAGGNTEYQRAIQNPEARAALRVQTGNDPADPEALVGGRRVGGPTARDRHEQFVSSIQSQTRLGIPHNEKFGEGSEVISDKPIFTQEQADNIRLTGNPDGIEGFGGSVTHKAATMKQVSAMREEKRLAEEKKRAEYENKQAATMKPGAEKDGSGGDDGTYRQANGSDVAAATKGGAGGKPGAGGAGEPAVITTDPGNLAGRAMKLRGVADLTVNGIPAGELSINLEGTGDA